MFDHKGWTKFDYDRNIAAWVNVAHQVAVGVVADPKKRAEWLQCEGTWFVGVDMLPSDEVGTLAETPLKGRVIDWLSQIETKPMHPAQLSVMYEGYPKPRKDEGDGAFKYRLKRDAAHVDGLLPVGEARRRMLKEPHAYILGVPLNSCSPDASPLVIWEGSHIIMAETFEKALKDILPQKWNTIDLTEVYHAARRHVFATCPRVAVHADPGEAYVVHRLALHGVAPWANGAAAPKEGRMIGYLRPELANVSQWVDI
jgi:hypothetical protein